MLKKTFILFSIGFLMLSSSCRHKTDLTGLKDVTYSSDIQPIIAGNCTQSRCHNGSGDRELFPLTTYDDLISGGISAGDPHGSRIYQAISNHSSESIMPPSPLPPLADDQIKLMYLWILQGAKNN